MSKPSIAFISFIILSSGSYSQRIPNSVYVSKNYWDSIPERITKLKSTVKYNPVDTLFYQVSELYYQLGGVKEAKEYALKALFAPIKTNYYDHVIIANYLAACNVKQALEIMSKSKGDTIFLKSKMPVYSPNLGNFIIYNKTYLKDKEDTLAVWLNKNNLNDYDYAINARDSYSIGKRKQAFQSLIVGLKKYPNSHWLYCRRGKIFMSEGKYRLAIKDFEKAIKLKDDEAESMLHQIERLLLLKKY